MIEIDEQATRRKLDDIASVGMHELNEHKARSAEIDSEFQKSRAEQAEAAKAMDAVVAQAHADNAAKKEETPAANAWARASEKPTVLSFGEEEHDETPQTRPQPWVPPSAAHESAPERVAIAEPEPAVRDRYLSFGMEDEEEQEQPAQPVRPSRQAPTRRAASVEAEEDDDWSGRSWVR